MARKEITSRKREAFLAALEKCGNVMEAAGALHIPRRTVYAWRKADPDFAKAWDEALEAGVDAIEATVIGRAHHGWLEPVFQGGKQVGEVRKFDNALAMRILEAHRPEKYRQRSTLDLNVIPNLAGRLDAAQKRIEEKSS